MRALVAVIAALLVAGCGVLGVSRTASDSEFRLTASVPRLTYQPGDSIDVRASLTYTGPARRVVVRGLFDQLVTLRFKQLDGPLSMSPVSDLMCSKHTTTLERGVPITFGPFKSAGWDPGSPTASFYVTWMSDPLVHLPAGRWQINADLQTCGGTGPGDTADHVFSTPPIILTVAP